MILRLSKIREWVDNQASFIDAARTLGIHPKGLHRLLNGNNCDIRISTLMRFADAMGVEPGELIKRAVIV